MPEDDVQPRTPSSVSAPVPDHQSVLRRAPLVGALSALLGGAAWVVWVVLGERQPPCCPRGVGNEFLPYEWWRLAAFGLLAVAAGTLAAGRSALPPGLARLGAALVCVGSVLGAVSLGLEAAGVLLDRPFPEILAIILLIPVGTLLLGAGAYAKQLLPRTVAVALLVGGAVFYVGNSERRTMLFWAVLGVAWSWWGAVALHHAGQRTARPSSSVQVADDHVEGDGGAEAGDRVLGGVRDRQRQSHGSRSPDAERARRQHPEQGGAAR